ncbi:sigma-70 family RNA polymerase sigma factor [Aliihoeflea aestuarii]|jgi:RNA polymerase sigma-70 factor, ECF subfamily|uniref:RNA polymerase sigma factor n=1 Tax=Aliihoeflea aestuarii TaxID=453840 RepID=UPI0020927C87|nr:RNA polymerase sigma factor [Aliihoeflea aestuarii]MCO6391071.1 sigma-70 family RNA polymerase sigma factor [Aliihoeflea aestuarii]
MKDADTIGRTLAAARPQAVGALLRYFRDLDRAQEAFQEASLRALRNWPKNGAPRDPAAWLIFVGRNVGIDAVRRDKRLVALPEEEALSDLSDVETPLVERLDGADYRDDILRLLFTCCDPALPPEHQVALALRIVSGLTVPQIARAFLISEAAMEQRITRAKARIAAAGHKFETPDAIARSQRVGAVAAMIYLVFNEGYSSRPENVAASNVLAEEAIRLGRLLLRLFPAEPEIMGLLALMLLQHARSTARLDDRGEIVLLADQDRSRWNAKMIVEGLALVDKAFRHRQPGSYQIQAAIAALHARAAQARDTDWTEIELLYRMLEAVEPSPVVTLNRAAALSKVKGPQAALDLIEPLADRLAGYFHYHGMRGGLLAELERCREAREAFDRAIALARTPAEAAHIRRHLDEMQA